MKQVEILIWEVRDNHDRVTGHHLGILADGSYITGRGCHGLPADTGQIYNHDMARPRQQLIEIRAEKRKPHNLVPGLDDAAIARMGPHGSCLHTVARALKAGGAAPSSRHP